MTSGLLFPACKPSTAMMRPAIALSLLLCAVAGRAARADEPSFTGEFQDGAYVTGGHVGNWHEPAAQPNLNGQGLFDANRPIRWLLNESAEPTAIPQAFVEMQGGDRLPGRVVAWQDGDARSRSDCRRTSGSKWRCLSICRRTAPDRNSRAFGRLAAYRLATAIERSICPWHAVLYRWAACRVSFRSLVGRGRGIAISGRHPARCLWRNRGAASAGNRPLGRLLRELGHLIGRRLDAADANRDFRRARRHDIAYPAAGQVDLRRAARLVSRAAPIWSLDPLWVRHTQVKWRRFFLPHEVPLSLISPARSVDRSSLGSSWQQRKDMSVQGNSLRNGARTYGWGLGVQAYSELHFNLPATARRFQTRVGLDESAGRGGCASGLIYLGDAQGTPLFQTNHLIGSAIHR